MQLGSGSRLATAERPEFRPRIVHGRGPLTSGDEQAVMCGQRLQFGNTQPRILVCVTED